LYIRQSNSVYYNCSIYIYSSEDIARLSENIDSRFSGLSVCTGKKFFQISESVDRLNNLQNKITKLLPNLYNRYYF